MSKLFLCIFISYAAVAAQEANLAPQSTIEQKFRAFDYDAVIELADQALQHADEYSADILIPIYEMKAVAHYSKTDMTRALNSFVAILNIDPSHELDPAKYSPKIVAFYNEIRASLQSPEDSVEHSNPLVADTVIVYRPDRSFQKLIYPSILAPGAGHWIGGKKQKGMILTGASTALLASSIYFTWDCARKERDYLNAYDQIDIDAKYVKYNSSFKVRNMLWGAYAVVWMYSQIDLYFTSKSSLQIGLTPPSAIYPSVGIAVIARL